MRHSLTLLALAFILVTHGQFKAINMDAFSNDTGIIFRELTNHIAFKGLKDLNSYGVSIEGAGLTSTYANIVLVSNVKSDTVIIHLLKDKYNKRKIIYSRKFIVQNAGKPKVIMKEETYQQPSGSNPFNYITV
jgi:hypothetical protein